MNDSYIPFHVAAVGEEEIAAVERVLRSGWLTTGPVAHEFEKEFANYIGCKHALAVNSGTAALQLALDAIGLSQGDDVLVPTYTFTATAEVVSYFGANVILCDNIAGGFNIDPGDAEKKITLHTKAIIPVHVGGEPCDMARLKDLAVRHNLKLVDDAAHALPTTYKAARIGTVSDLTAFSFYATKTITTGEGGMLTTDNDSYAERAALMRLHGIGRDAWNRYSRTGSWSYQVLAAGYKLNLCDILCALGLEQLRKADRFWQERVAIAQHYRERLAEVEEVELPPAGEEGCQHAWHLFILRLKSQALEITRDEFIEELKMMGIGTSVHFIPLHRHPYYAETYGCTAAAFPNAEAAFAGAISLPIYPGLTREQADRVVDAVQRIIFRNQKRKVAV